MKLQSKFRQQGWSFACFVLTLFLVSSFHLPLSLIIACHYLGSSIDISCSRQPGTSIQWHGDTPSLLAGHLAAVFFNTIVFCLLFIPAAVLHTSSTSRTPVVADSPALSFHQLHCFISRSVSEESSCCCCSGQPPPFTHEISPWSLSTKDFLTRLCHISSAVINTFFSSFTCLSWLNYSGG